MDTLQSSRSRRGKELAINTDYTIFTLYSQLDALAMQYYASGINCSGDDLSDRAFCFCLTEARDGPTQIPTVGRKVQSWTRRSLPALMRC